MKLIVGLGNPGSEYAKTRHNAGFLAVDDLVHRHMPDGPRAQFHSQAFEARIAGEKCLLLKPQTYMNRSGLSVGEAANFYKLAPEDVLILVDDLALPAGRIRLRKEGSPGGHNGLIDIERALGTRAYPRLRIGIDPRGRAPQKDYVLGRFTEAQREAFDDTLPRINDAIQCWIQDGIEKAMSLYNAG